jgi:hypothetical protein
MAIIGLVLCTDATKVVLCPSPVFRVMSMTTRPSSIRGASLGTLPLEVGARVLSGVAKKSAKTAIGDAVQQQIRPYKSSWGTKIAAKAAYDFSGMAGRVDASARDANLLYVTKRDQAWG